MRYRIEARAAAVMHDTVLGHLAAIANAPTARSPRSRRARSSATSRSWSARSGSRRIPAATASADRADWQQSQLLAAIEESRRLGLDVAVSGDLAAVGRLDAERSKALGLAAKQCLVNVLRHAGTDHADVVVYGSDSDVSVMVIDDGKGFVVSETAPDRLGIRESVRRRLESAGGDVQLWSTPGSRHVGAAADARRADPGGDAVSHRERTIEQLDPMSAVNGWPITILGAIGVVVYASVMTFFNARTSTIPCWRSSRSARSRPHSACSHSLRAR